MILRLKTDFFVIILQDCVLIVPAKPWFAGVNGDDPETFDPELDFDGTMIGRLQLLFRCTVRPLNNDGSHRKDSGDDFRLQLMFYSTFENCNLTPEHPLQRRGMRMVYDPSPVPILYVGLVKHALCRVPLMPCFLRGNATPTIPAYFLNKKAEKFPYGEVDVTVTEET